MDSFASFSGEASYESHQNPRSSAIKLKGAGWLTAGKDTDFAGETGGQCLEMPSDLHVCILLVWHTAAVPILRAEREQCDDRLDVNPECNP